MEKLEISWQDFAHAAGLSSSTLATNLLLEKQEIQHRDPQADASAVSSAVGPRQQARAPKEKGMTA